VKRREKIERATGWGMVFVGAFILVLGLFTHNWWVYSGQHSLFETVTQEERVIEVVAERLGVSPPHAHGIPAGTGLFGLPFWLGNWVLVLLWIIPIWWYWIRERKRIRLLPEAERSQQLPILQWKKWFFLTLTILLVLIFLYVIPHWFLAHKALENEESKIHPEEVTLQINSTLYEPQLTLKDKEGNS